MKRLIRRTLLRILESGGTTYYPMWRYADRTCPICGFTGRFIPFGLYYIRPDAKCPNCKSLERNRQMALFLQDEPALISAEKDVLHFAPDKMIMDLIKDKTKAYTTADLFREDVDKNWNIEQIACEDSSFDTVICSHVLEHVNTAVALNELHRILKPGGHALIMVPICEGLDQTYYNDAVKADEDRWKHFQQTDHARVLGKDFRDMITEAGFSLREHIAQGEMAVKYGLVMGERIFIAQKAS